MTAKSLTILSVKRKRIFGIREVSFLQTLQKRNQRADQSMSPHPPLYRIRFNGFPRIKVNDFAVFF
ncbi:MAG: hypothetical protein AAB351_02645 [Patescibacteria group bacterium]